MSKVNPVIRKPVVLPPDKHPFLTSDLSEVSISDIYDFDDISDFVIRNKTGGIIASCSVSQSGNLGCSIVDIHEFSYSATKKPKNVNEAALIQYAAKELARFVEMGCIKDAKEGLEVRTIMATTSAKQTVWEKILAASGRFVAVKSFKNVGSHNTITVWVSNN